MPNLGETVTLFVNGTLMRGYELHGNLAAAEFVRPARTAPRYQLYSIADRHPAMRRSDENGVSVQGELYLMSLPVLAQVMELEPPGLGLEVVELENGSLTLGIVWVASDLPSEATDISSYGGWRPYQGAPVA